MGRQSKESKPEDLPITNNSMLSGKKPRMEKVHYTSVPLFTPFV